MQQQDIPLEYLGPLSQLIGSWEGDKGHDITQANKQSNVELSIDKPYREEITFEPFGPVQNGDKSLYGLRYTTCAWPNGEKNVFHQELGYWLWSPEDNQIVRCFTNQNGVTIHAGGECNSQSQHIEMIASADSDEYGISSCPNFNDGCKTLSYKLEMDMLNESQFTYTEEIHLKSTGNDDVMVHTDTNALTRLY